MRNFYPSLLIMVFELILTPAFGQSGVDTLGLTGGMGDTVVANRLLGRMPALIKERKWEEACSMGNIAISIYINTLGEESAQVADVLHQRGVIEYNKGDYAMALNYWERSLNIRLKVLGTDNLIVAKNYSNLGLIYYNQGKYDKSIVFNQKALEIRLKNLDPYQIEVAISYNNLSMPYQGKGDFENAILYSQKALEIRLKTLGPDHPDVAQSYNNLSTSWRFMGEYEKSIEYAIKGLDIRLKTLGPKHPTVSSSYYNLGVSYDGEGEYDLAITYYQKALGIRLETMGPEHPDVAVVYVALGVAYDAKGEYNKALQNYEKALEIQLKTLGSENDYVALTYNNLGGTFVAMGENNKAIVCYQKALDIRLKNFGPENVDVGNTYHNIGAYYGIIGDFDKAIEYDLKALEILLKTIGPEHLGVASVYNNLGASYGAKKEFKKQIEFNEKAIKIRLKALGTKHPDVADAYNDLGASYRLSNEWDRALEFYYRALDACGYSDRDFSKVNSMKELLISLEAICYILKTQYNMVPLPKLLIESQSYALLSLAAIDYQSSAFIQEDSKLPWQSHNYPIIEQAINVLLLMPGSANNSVFRHKAFTYAEKSKASLLQAQSKAADALAFAGLPDSLLQKEHNLRIDITWREKQRQSLLDKGLSETDTNTLRISSIIFDLKNNYEALKKRFETEYPEYYRLKYDLSTVSLQYVQDTLLEPKNQALLEYFVGDSSIYLFVVRPDTMILEEVKRDFPLEDWIEGLRQGLYGYYTADKALRSDSLRQATLAQYIEFAPKLYQKLIAPIAQLLPKKVILVPDGPLGYIPFDALLTGVPEDANDFKSYPYLIQKHQFSYTYSATLLREMRDKKHRQEPQKDFVAFAPFYNGDTTLLANMYAYDDLMRKDLQPLAFSGPEVAAASKLMHGETVAGAAATEERFTSTAGNYRIIHLATHGRADNRVGDYAFLAFTEIKDSLENELLYVKDLYNLQLNADLVVLSACETGIGKLQRGEGIISLARAFAYAGAKSIVTSLWSVNDKSTSELMRMFYRELQRGKDKDEALRLARLRFLKESSVRNGHPFFWAAFVPLGDMRAVK